MHLIWRRTPFILKKDLPARDRLGRVVLAMGAPPCESRMVGFFFFVVFGIGEVAWEKSEGCDAGDWRQSPGRSASFQRKAHDVQPGSRPRPRSAAPHRTPPEEAGRLYRPWLEPCEQRILLTEGLLANGPGAPSLLESVGANRAITTDPDVQQMPSVAVDPADPQHVVIAYMDRSLVTTGYAGIGVAVSRDGGSNWQHTAVPLPSGFDQGAANPIVRFDGQGHVFVSFMAATFKGPQPALTNADFGDRGLPGIQSNNGVFVARSDNGGLIWNPPIAVVSHTYSGQPVDFEVTPDLAIDTFRTLPDGSPNPRYGAMYETWTRIYPPGQFPGDPTATGGTDVMLAVSKDQGETWQTLLQTQPGTGLQVSVIQDPVNAGDAPLGSGRRRPVPPGDRAGRGHLRVEFRWRRLFGLPFHGRRRELRRPRP